MEFFNENDPEQEKLKDRLKEFFDNLTGLNTYEKNWGAFLDSQKKIVILSTSADGIRKGRQLIDMMLASLYEYKQHDHDPRYTIILDEIEDLCPEKDRLGKIIGNCGILVFFRPKTNNISDISKLTGIDKSTFVNLEQGQCIVYGPLYNKYEDKNKNVTLIGQTYTNNK